MLASLSIKNYALIDSLKVDFNQGLTIITGETGAGKSILLGGLSLILGKRADLNSLKNSDQKCIIEAVFNIENYKLEPLFKAEDLDFEPQTIIRREILPSGKSRAFINDSPVNLSTMQIVGEHLIDIHSQHQTLQLTNNEFQFKIIDALAKNADQLDLYQGHLKNYKKLQKELQDLIVFKSEAVKEHDYNAFLLNELEQAQLRDGELELLEVEYKTLNNIEEIKEKLSYSHQILSDDEVGVLANLAELKNTMLKLASISNQYSDISSRIHSSFIELDDVFSEVESLQLNLDANPNRLEEVNTKLQQLHNLMQKHVAKDVSELIAIKTNLEEQVVVSENIDHDIQEKENQIEKAVKELNTLSERIHKNRKQAIPDLLKQLIGILKDLGMPNAQFKIDVVKSENFFSNGKDELQFMFSANKGGQFNELKKAASGGELSRIMLAIKSILSKYIQLPSIMFDEIDTGVSGEISNKMGQIMLQMSQSMQVFTITHLPQIAAKGHTHFKVYKEDINNITTTNLVHLNHDDRIVEIAQMLGGIEITNSAIAHAKQLLN